MGRPVVNATASARRPLVMAVPPNALAPPVGVLGSTFLTANISATYRPPPVRLKV